MLQYFYDNDLINITNQEPKDWEEAIRISGKVLKEKELISDQYIMSFETFMPLALISSSSLMWRCRILLRKAKGF